MDLIVIEYPKDNYKPGRELDTDLSDKYFSKHMVEYETITTTGRDTLEVLPTLTGCLWNNGALNMIHSLRPSCIRVSYGETTTDSVLWRVTVIVEKQNKDNVIKKIKQEVEIGRIGKSFNFRITK